MSENVFTHLILCFQDKTELIGYAIGILSSIFYLGSRIAQIVKNVSAPLILQASVKLNFLFCQLGLNFREISRYITVNVLSRVRISRLSQSKFQSQKKRVSVLFRTFSINFSLFSIPFCYCNFKSTLNYNMIEIVKFDSDTLK